MALSVKHHVLFLAERCEGESFEAPPCSRKARLRVDASVLRWIADRFLSSEELPEGTDVGDDWPTGAAYGP